MKKSENKRTTRRAKHTIFVDDKAFNKYTALKELITKVTGRRADNSAVVDALITTIADKGLIDDFIEIYNKKIAERKGLKEEQKVDIEEYVEILKS